MRDNLPQVQPDCVAQLQTACGQHARRILLQVGIDPRPYNCIFHSYIVATFSNHPKSPPTGFQKTLARRLPGTENGSTML
jgi:hypothetical protein